MAARRRVMTCGADRGPLLGEVCAVALAHYVLATSLPCTCQQTTCSLRLATPRRTAPHASHRQAASRRLRGCLCAGSRARRRPATRRSQGDASSLLALLETVLRRLNY